MSVALANVVERVAREAADLERELTEVEMLVSQVRTEAARHEARRAAAAEKLAALPPDATVASVADQTAQLLTLTRRAAVMEAQIEVLEGKQKALSRYRDGLARVAAELGEMGSGGTAAESSEGAADAMPGMSRIVLSAQEDLRREIARAMHDGPAQSLTNIVLEAEIVDRLVGKDDDAARREMKVLAAMVQQTLEATKSFIFDVRPMVLDDLGLVPTLRRAARERSRRARVPVEFDSIGQDRRLPMDVESGLFRIADEAIAAYLDAVPDRVTVRLDWNDDAVDLAVLAVRAAPEPTAVEELPETGNMPPALAAMIEDRRAAQVAAREAVQAAARVVLPATVARELSARAAALGGSSELVDGGAGIRISVRNLPVQAPAAT